MLKRSLIMVLCFIWTIFRIEWSTWENTTCNSYSFRERPGYYVQNKSSLLWTTSALCQQFYQTWRRIWLL